MWNKSSQVLGVLILFCTPGIFSLLQGECETGSCSRVYQNSQEQVRNKENMEDFTSNEDRMSSTRIIGPRGAFNYEHAVRIALINDFKTAHCTGVMQNALYIITAAHCVDKLDLSQVIVTAGLKPYQEQNRSVVLVEIYQDWDPKTRLHDIAILKLNDSLTLAHSIVKPVELGGLNYVNGSDAELWITGFGLTKIIGGNLTYPGGFLQTTAPVIDIHACKEIYQKLGKTLNTNQICAGGKLGFGPCTGDDGAPLTARVYFGELYQTFVVGILSSYEGCAAGVPDIYTDLENYKNWIESIAGRQCDFNTHAFDINNSKKSTSYNFLSTPKARIQGTVAKTVCAAFNQFLKTNLFQSALTSPDILQKLAYNEPKVADDDACLNWQWNTCFGCQRFIPNKCQNGDQHQTNVATNRNSALRIFGGHDAAPHQHPYLVRIELRNDDRINKFLCTGVIYNSVYVLTSARTVYRHLPCSLTVIAGDYRISVQEETEQVRQVVSIAVHEQFIDTWGHNNNIAILKINNPFNFTKNVDKILLATKEYPTTDVKLVELSGWARLEASDVIQTDVVPFVDDCDCILSYPHVTGNLFTTKKFCVGKFAHGFCDEHVGNLLTVQDSGIKYLVGIASFGGPCGLNSGVATKILAYTEWITVRAGF